MTEDVCGISGVPDDGIHRLNSTSTMFFGKEFREPTEKAKEVNMVSGAYALKRPNDKLMGGYLWPRGDNKWVASIRGIGSHVFNSSEEATRFLRDKAGLEVLSKMGDGEKLRTHGDFVMAFDDRNAFGNAGDLRRAVALVICRLTGNTPEASAYLTAVDHSLSEHQFNKFTRLLRATDRLRNRSQAWRDTAAFLNTLPAGELDKTLAGRWLNAGAWINEGLFNAAGVLERESVSGNIPEELKNKEHLSLSDRYVIADAQRHAANVGHLSPLSQMLHALNGVMKERGIKNADLMRFREALFHPTRAQHISDLLETRLQAAKDEWTKTPMDKFVRDRERAAIKRNGEFTDEDRKAAQQEFRNTEQIYHLKGFEEKQGNLIRYRHREENPLAFTHTTDDGTVLEGQEAVNHYLGTLSAERYEDLAAANAVISHGIDTVHNLARREGVLNEEQMASIEKYGSNYIPQRTDEIINNIMPAYGPVGRFEKIKDPFRAITNYMDTVTRISNENMVRRTIVNDLRSFTDSPIWNLERIEGSLKDHDREDGFVVSHPASPEHPDGYREKLVIHPDALNTSAGKSLQKLLKSKQPSQIMQFIAGYTKFSSIMYTTARPAWALKSLAMNTCITPFALQSALGVSAEEATGMLFGAGGKRGSYLGNAMKEMQYRFAIGAGKGARTDEMTAAFHDLAEQYGASSAEDSRYYGNNLMLEGRRAEGGILERMNDEIARRRDQGSQVSQVTGRAGVLKDEAKHYFGKYSAIQHAPDEMFRVAAFRSFVEHEALKRGVTLNSREDVEQFLKSDRDMADKAAVAATKIMPQFSRKGNMRFLNTLFPFFNASMQTLPFMKQMAFSKYGATGFGLMIAAGFMGAQIAREEYGDAGEDLKGGDSSIYIGNGVAIPQDYAFGPALRMGQALEHMFNSDHFDHLKELGGVAESFAKSFSPFDVPWKGQSTGMWLATHIMPPAISAPMLTTMHLNEDGTSYLADNPTDENGHALANPAGYEYGKQGDSVLSTQFAKGLHEITGGIIDAAPGAVTNAFRILAPSAEDVVNNAMGERDPRYGGEDPGNLFSRIRQILAPNFSAAPTYADGRDDFEDKMHSILPKGGASMQDYQNGLAGDETQRKVANLYKETLSAESKLTVDTDYGPMNQAQIKHALIQAERDGDWDKMRGLRVDYYHIRGVVNNLWRDAAGRIESDD